uniref:Uncharacterized protein n=1 Tax=Manihot esculenta TaxID=3983 RepID=A0A2C9VGZ1_MANES
MAKDGPNWEGLLKWSLSHADCTGSKRKLSEEDRRCLWKLCKPKVFIPSNA